MKLSSATLLISQPSLVWESHLMVNKGGGIKGSRPVDMSSGLLESVQAHYNQGNPG